MSVTLVIVTMALVYHGGGQLSLLPMMTVMETSWYGEECQGREMAYGGKFDKNNPQIAAHKTLPPGTELELVNPAKGKAIRVRVKDRGPHVPGRDLDISRAAAERIGIKEAGHSPLLVRIVK